MLDVLDAQGNKTGVTKSRAEVHAKGLWHRAAHIWAYNSRGELLLQKRSVKVENHPGLWDTSAAGHIPAGEEPLDAAIREVGEELGIKVTPSDLKFVMINRHDSDRKDYVNKEFEFSYVLRLEKLPTNIQKSEVESVKFIPLDELEKELKDPELAKKYVPHGKYYFEIIKIIRGELKK